MKKMLSIAAIALLLSVSCGEGPGQDPEPGDTSLAGMTFGGAGHWDTFSAVDGGGGMIETEIVFSETTVRFYEIWSPFRGDDRVFDFTGTYRYHPPVLTVTDADGTEYTGEVTEYYRGGLILDIEIQRRGFHFYQKVPLEEPPQKESTDLTGIRRSGLHMNDGSGDAELELVFTTETVHFSCTNYPEGREVEDVTTTYELKGTYTCYDNIITVNVTSPEFLAGARFFGLYDDSRLEMIEMMRNMRTELMKGEVGSETEEE